MLSIARLGLSLIMLGIFVPAFSQTFNFEPTSFTSSSPSHNQKRQSDSETWSVATFSNWDDNLNQWVEGFRATSTRNAQSRPLETLQEFKSNGNWENLSLINMHYDANGVLDSLIQKTWDGSTWQNNRKLITRVNANGLVDYQMESYWNDSLNIYEVSNGIRITYVLNVNQQILIQETEVLNNGTNLMWEKLRRFTNSYNANMELDTSLYESFTNGAFTPSGRTIYLAWEDYNQFLWEENIQQVYSQGNFSPQFRNTNVRNGLKRISTNFEWMNNVWEPRGKTERTVDNQDCPDLVENFDMTNGAFMFVSGENFINTYNANGEAMEIINQLANTDSIYINNYKWEYTFPAVGTASPSEDLSSLTVYPNPFSSELQVGGELARSTTLNLVLTDVQGRKVFSHTWKADSGRFHTQMNLPDLPSGLYSYAISDGVSTANGKLIHR